MLLFLITVPSSDASEMVEYTGYKYKDPFRKAFFEKNRPDVVQPLLKIPNMDNTSTYWLAGTLWNATKPRAIINGQIVKVGDKIGNAEVLKITKEGVLMKEFNREFVLSQDVRKSK